MITTLRCCRTKSLNSPQTLGVLEVKLEHCDLLQREFRHFQKKFLLWKLKLDRSWTIRLLNTFQRNSLDFEKKFWLRKLKLLRCDPLSLHPRISPLLHLQCLFGHFHSTRPFRWWIRRSFQAFRRSLQSSTGDNFRSWGEIGPIVSKHKNFIVDVMVTETRWLWFWIWKGASSAASLQWSGNYANSTGERRITAWTVMPTALTPGNCSWRTLTSQSCRWWDLGSSHDVRLSCSASAPSR
jgi:hypothetical protein